MLMLGWINAYISFTDKDPKFTSQDEINNNDLLTWHAQNIGLRNDIEKKKNGPIKSIHGEKYTNSVINILIIGEKPERKYANYVNLRN